VKQGEKNKTANKNKSADKNKSANKKNQQNILIDAASSPHLAYKQRWAKLL
jgi:hypothetical protein